MWHRPPFRTRVFRGGHRPKELIMNAPYLLTLVDAGLPALRVISILAVLIFAAVGTYIYRHRHQLFDRDPQLAEYQDGPGFVISALELVLVIWGALMLVTIATLFGIWRA